MLGTELNLDNKYYQATLELAQLVRNKEMGVEAFIYACTSSDYMTISEWDIYLNDHDPQVRVLLIMDGAPVEAVLERIDGIAVDRQMEVLIFSGSSEELKAELVQILECHMWPQHTMKQHPSYERQKATSETADLNASEKTLDTPMVESTTQKDTVEREEREFEDREQEKQAEDLEKIWAQVQQIREGKFSQDERRERAAQLVMSLLSGEGPDDDF